MKLKTRTNQPVEYEIETTTDIEHLSDSFLDSLKCGDIITKKTGDMKHAYVVSYKEEKQGICLTYCDASGYIETISYDYVGEHWVFNSKDVFNGTDKTYVDTELAKKANLSGASFTGAITSPSIIEDMSGYSFAIGTSAGWTYEGVYAGVVKNGNKLTFVVAINITRTDDDVVSAWIGQFTIPSSIGDKLFPTQVGSYQFLDVRQIPCAQNENTYKVVNAYVNKVSNTYVRLLFDDPSKNLTKNVKYYVRYELTFLLSDNLI